MKPYWWYLAKWVGIIGGIMTTLTVTIGGIWLIGHTIGQTAAIIAFTALCILATSAFFAFIDWAE